MTNRAQCLDLLDRYRVPRPGVYLPATTIAGLTGSSNDPLSIKALHEVLQELVAEGLAEMAHGVDGRPRYRVAPTDGRIYTPPARWATSPKERVLTALEDLDAMWPGQPLSTSRICVMAGLIKSTAQRRMAQSMIAELVLEGRVEAVAGGGNLIRYRLAKALEPTP